MKTKESFQNWLTGIALWFPKFSKTKADADGRFAFGLLRSGWRGFSAPAVGPQDTFKRNPLSHEAVITCNNQSTILKSFHPFHTDGNEKV